MDSNTTFASTIPKKPSTPSPVPWWVGFVVAGAFLIVAVVMVILFVKKPSSSPPSNGPMQCDANTCPDGTCVAGKCRYQCNTDNCPTNCEDNVCKDPTNVCQPGGDIKGVCENDGTCSSDCDKCGNTCESTCKTGTGLEWDATNNQCILASDWSTLSCPDKCKLSDDANDYCPYGYWIHNTPYDTRANMGNCQATQATFPDPSQIKSNCTDKRGWTVSSDGYTCTPPKK